MKHNFSVIVLLVTIFTLSAFTAKADVPDYFKVTATQGTSTVYLYKRGAPAGKVYCTLTPEDNSSWVEAPISTTASTPTNAITLSEGQSLYLKGAETNKTNGLNTGTSAYYAFRFKGTSSTMSASGNIMSLIDPNLQDTLVIPTTYCFQYLFGEYSSSGTTYSSSALLTDVSKLRLPATELKNSCYGYMFYKAGIINCFKELPAKVATPSAYANMFRQCTALIHAPNIKATKVGSSSMEFMFYGCTALIVGPDSLLSEVVPHKCCTAMFYDCSALKQAPIIMAKTPRSSINGGAATSSNGYNCAEMFSGCSSLDTITAFFNEWCTINNAVHGETYKWTNNVKTKGVFYNPYQCYIRNTPTRGSIHYIPSGSNKWEVRAFWDYTFNLNGGTWSNNTTQDSVKRCYVDLPYNVTTAANYDTIVAAVPKQAFKIGYEFMGWNIDKNASPYTQEGWIETDKYASKFIYDNQTFYAIYREIAIAANITFDNNGGVWDESTKIESTITLPSPVQTAPITQKVNYEFSKWNTAPDGSGSDFVQNYPYTSDITFYAIWNPTFTFELTHGGKWENESAQPLNLTISQIDALTSNFPMAYRENYSLIGWNTDLSATSNNFDKSNLPSLYTTFYTIWTPLYTFDVATNSGTWDGEDNANKAWTKAELSASPTPLTDAVRAGYHFEGWFDSNGNQYTEAEILDDTPATFYARFTPEYTFIPNGGTWDDQTTTNKVLFGSFTLPAIARNGYALDGWTPAFTPTELPEEPTTYTANWTKLTYTFDVATNGGTWEDGTNATTTRTVDDINSLPIPKKDKQSFLGWKDANGQRMRTDNLPDEATTYYAQFGELQYLCITALTDNVNIGTYHWNSTIPFDLYYSTNGDEWTKAYTNNRNTFVTLNKGQKVWLKGTNHNGINTDKYTTSTYIKFTISDSVSLSGNLMTLIDGENPPLEIPGNTYNNYCFAKLFQHIREYKDQYCKIISAKDLQLPATLLKEGCYENLFLNNTYLQEAPADLSSAENVPTNAYNSMFDGCSHLISAPRMPQVDTISTNGFKAMFKGCSSLQIAPTLPAKRLGKAAYEQMFYGCTSLRQLEVGFFTWSEEQVKTNVYPTYYWMHNVPNTSDFVFRAPCQLDVTSIFDENHTLSDWTYDCIPYDTIITTNTTTSELPTLSNITVTEGVTLTIDENYAATDITILGGGNMVVSEGKTLTARSITLYGGDYNGENYRFIYPQMVVNGTIQNAEGGITPITYDYLINKKQYYTMAIPANVNAKEVLYPDGVGAPYKVQTYDGAARAEFGTAKNCWIDVWNKYNPFDPATPDITFEVGRGYTVFCKPQNDVYSPLAFPITADFREAGEPKEKTLDVYGYGCTDGLPTVKTNSGNVGWNVLGNPFFTNFGGNDYLSLETTTGTFPILYVIMPNEDGTYYQVELLSNISIPAFNNFFVQIFNDGTLHFVRGNKTNNAPRRATMADDVAAFGLRVEDAKGTSDRLGFFLSNDFTDEYDPYYDLSKWQNNGLNLYVKHAGNNLSMMAVNPTTMENEIPLTLAIPATGRYTFSLVDEWARNLWAYDHIYLYDKTTGVTTDLTVEDYAFSATQGTSTTRFVISANKNTETTTDNALVSDNNEKRVKPVKYIEDGKLIILRNGLRYDANGHCLE